MGHLIGPDGEKDYGEYLRDESLACPECNHVTTQEVDRSVWFCPSFPDKCDGCEIDTRLWCCPDCGHEWRR